MHRTNKQKKEHAEHSQPNLVICLLFLCFFVLHCFLFLCWLIYERVCYRPRMGRRRGTMGVSSEVISEKGAYGFHSKRWIFFVVTVQELEFSGREFQIPRPFTPCENFSLLAWNESCWEDQWRLPRRDFLTGVNFHAVKLRVNTCSLRETYQGWMKSNLFFFVLFFLSPSAAFLTGKNKNTWSCQAKFGEVNPHKKIIFLSEYSSFFK